MHVCNVFLYNTYIQIELLTITLQSGYDLASHTTYVVSGGIYVDSEQQIFKKLFMGILFIPQSFCQKSAERKSAKTYFHIFVLMSDLEF